MQTTSRSHDAEGTPTDWTGVCEFDGLEPLWGEAALIDGVQIALVLLPDGSLYAVSNQDPATGSFVMSRGIVGSRGARPTLASPLHKQVYDLETGECFTSPEYALRTFPVRIDNGMVQVQVREQVELGSVQGVDAEFAAA
ncbi:nitrite reductase small subunit NirD [Cryobacterium sp. AP23]